MNVTLTPDLERKIAEKVEAGHYASRGDVVRDALRLLFEADDQHRQRLETDIRIGLDQAERGELIDGEESRQRIASRFATSRS